MAASSGEENEPQCSSSSGSSSTRAGEVQAFVGSIVVIVSCGLYLVWAYVPDSVLVAIGLSYHPSKHWASVIPALLIVTVVCALIFYSGLNRLSVQPASSKYSIHDNSARMQPPPTPSIYHPLSHPPCTPSHNLTPHSSADRPSTVPSSNKPNNVQGSGLDPGVQQAGSSDNGMRLYHSPSARSAMQLSHRAPIPPIHDLPITLVNDMLYA